MHLALLGDPVAHSRSPAIHLAALASVGIDGTYEARRTDAAGVRDAIEEIRNGTLAGANVTMPLKRAALEMADVVAEDAARAGAVNTLVQLDAAVRGENTDIGGLVDVATSSAQPSDAPVLVLGAGGAAGAAVVAFESREIVVSARRSDSATALLASTGVGGTRVEWGRPVPGAVVVNATPLGMRGESLPAGLLHRAVGLIDLAYGPAPTPAVSAHRGRIPVADGVDVLVAQAARSFSLWTGVPAPLQVMEHAARAS